MYNLLLLLILYIIFFKMALQAIFPGPLSQNKEKFYYSNMLLKEFVITAIL